MHVYLATVFHLIMAYGGAYVLYLTTPIYYGFFYYNEQHIDLIHILFGVTFAYFFIDLITMIKNYKTSQFVYFIHHLIGLGATIATHFYYMNFVRYYLTFLLYEISTPFLNISYYYHKKNITNVISIISEIIFATTFVSIRVIGGTYLTYNLCQDILKNDMNIMLCGLPIILQLLMYYWFHGIINMFKKKCIGFN